MWGVRFTPECFGASCNQGDDRIRVFANGKPFRGDPTELPLQNEQVIVATYGTAGEVPSPMPARFAYEGSPEPATTATR